MGAKVLNCCWLELRPLISLPVMVTSATWPDSTWAIKSLNLTGVSFFWIWAKCQAKKTTTSNDIHSITVLNVAFTILGLQTLQCSAPPYARGPTPHGPMATAEGWCQGTGDPGSSPRSPGRSPPRSGRPWAWEG